MNKLRRCLALLIVVFAASLPPLTAVADESPFVRPAELEPDIAFWRKVYTQVTTEGGLLHDQSAPGTCHECETSCCRSCAVEIEARTYCGWCATLVAAAAGA